MMAPRQTKETSSHSQVTGLLVCVWPGPFFFFVCVVATQPTKLVLRVFSWRILYFITIWCSSQSVFLYSFFFCQAFRFFLRCKMMVSKQIHFLQSSLVHFFFTTALVVHIFTLKICLCGLWQSWNTYLFSNELRQLSNSSWFCVKSNDTMWL